jgi:uncharacterized coiled-coil protein SlyX
MYHVNMNGRHDMPRPGLTYDDVAAAADELVKLGITTDPTVKAIRERLGTGSNSTIGEHLRAWRAARQAVPAPVFELSPGVAAAVAKDIEAKVDAVRGPMEERERTAVAHQAEAERTADRLEGELAAAQARTAELERLIAEERGRAAQLRDDLSAVEGKLGAAEQRAAVAEKDAAVANAQLVAAEQRAAEALERERQARDELRTAVVPKK